MPINTWKVVTHHYLLINWFTLCSAIRRLYRKYYPSIGTLAHLCWSLFYAIFPLIRTFWWASFWVILTHWWRAFSWTKWPCSTSWLDTFTWWQPSIPTEFTYVLNGCSVLPVSVRIDVISRLDYVWEVMLRSFTRKSDMASLMDPLAWCPLPPSSRYALYTLTSVSIFSFNWNIFLQFLLLYGEFILYWYRLITN